MTHDPLCALSKAECRASQDARHSIVTNTAWCDACQDDCQCDLIAQVRADERKQAEARVETLRNHPGLITISAAAALAAGDTWTSQL